MCHCRTKVARIKTKLRTRTGRQKKARLRKVAVILPGGPMRVWFQVGRETQQEPQVRLLAKLGGWVPRKNAKPGKIILTRGLRRLLDMFAARSILKDYLNQHGSLPPQVAAFLPDDFF